MAAIPTDEGVDRAYSVGLLQRMQVCDTFLRLILLCWQYSGFFHTRDMDRFSGGIQGPGNLHRLANIWLNPILIVQLIRSFGRRIVENKLTGRFGEMRPIEYAPLFFGDAFNSFHGRLNTVQVLVRDFALECGSLSGSEWDDHQDQNNKISRG